MCYPCCGFNSHYALAAVSVTVTVRVSPDTTDREEPKSTTPYNVPAVPDFVLLDVIKAPAQVLVAFIEKVALLEVLSQVLVVVPVIDPSVRVCRTT